MGKDNVPQGSVSGWDWFPTVFLCLFGLIWFGSLWGEKSFSQLRWTWGPEPTAKLLLAWVSQAPLRLTAPSLFPPLPPSQTPVRGASGPQWSTEQSLENIRRLSLSRAWNQDFWKKPLDIFLMNTGWNPETGIYFFLLWMQSWVAELGEVNPGHPSTEVGVHISAYLSWKRKPPEKSLQSQSPADPTL